MDKKEIWIDVVEYEGLYKVNNKGFIKNKKSRILSKRIKKGYNTCRLSKKGDYKEFLVHRLVAIAFIPNPENKPQVNHIDGDKLNNNYWNLEWNTVSENTQHAYDSGLINVRKGEQVHNSILTAEKVLEIRQRYKDENITQKALSIVYGVNQVTISDAISKRRWKHI